MNDHIENLIKKAGLNTQYVDYFGPALLTQFAKSVAKECASIARNTDLEDVDGGDDAVLQAAADQIEKHFGI